MQAVCVIPYIRCTKKNLGHLLNSNLNNITNQKINSVGTL